MTVKHTTDLDVARDIKNLCDVVNEAIEDARDVLEDARDLLQNTQVVKSVIEEIETRSLANYDHAERINSELHSLRDLPNQISQLGVTPDFWANIKQVLASIKELEKYQEIYTQIETKHLQFNQTNKNIESNLGQINQVLLDIGGIENLRQLLDQSITAQTSLDETKQEAIAVHDQISQIILETGGIENLRQLLNQYTMVQNSLDRSTDKAIAIRSLDAYLMEFHKPRNHREIRKFLWNELGFVGLIIYFLRLITPRK